MESFYAKYSFLLAVENTWSELDSLTIHINLL